MKKRNIINIRIILLVIVLLVSIIMQQETYAISRTSAINKSISKETTETVSKETTKIVEQDKKVVDNVIETNTTNARTKILERIYKNIEETSSKKIVKQTTTAVEKPAEKVETEKPIEGTITTPIIEEPIIETPVIEEKPTVEEKPIIEETIDATLETVIYKNFEPIEKVELGSQIVHTIYLKNTTQKTRTIRIDSNMPKAIFDNKIIASICNVENIIEEGEEFKGLIEKQKINLFYSDTLKITLRPNEEKAIVVKQNVIKYAFPTVKNTFTITNSNQEIILESSQLANRPAKINAEMKLYVNDIIIESNEKIQLTGNDKIQYIINLQNTGGTKEALDIELKLPKKIKITKIEYFEEGNKLLSEIQYSGNEINLKNQVILAGDSLKIVLTAEENLTKSETEVSTYANITGVEIKELSTNLLNHTFVKQLSGNEQEPKFSFTKLKEIAQQKGTTEDILSLFGNIEFQALANDNATSTTTYGKDDIGENVVIRFREMFSPSTIMYCVNSGISYWRFFEIENLYATYNGEIYRYVDTDGDGQSELEEGNLPQDGVGIGNDYNLINENYNQLAYILSEIDNYGTYPIPGINQEEGNRIDHRLSPIQIAIWKLQGKYTEEQIIQKIRSGLNDAGITAENEIISITNGILAEAMQVYANSEAYNTYVEEGKIEEVPEIDTSNYTEQEINGKKLVGPFVINFEGISQVPITYTNASNETKSVNGKYGEFTEITLTQENNTHSNIYDGEGNEITIEGITTSPIEIYFDLTGTNFDITKTTKINIKMNNQYRQAYFYTLDSIYDKQDIIIGQGVSSIGEYEIEFQTELELITLSGKVWLDIPQGIKPVLPPNGEIEANEEGIEGIEVYLVNNSTQTLIQTTTTNSEGEYIFEDVDKNDYSILFAYDGINYIETTGEGEASQAAENIDINGQNIRTNFNTRFTPITKNKRITKKYELLQTGEIIETQASHIMSYNTIQNENQLDKSELITTTNRVVLPVYKMFAKTETSYNETTENINLGLIERKGDLSIYTDMTQINSSFITYEVDLNNQEETTATVNSIKYYYTQKLEFVSAEYRNSQIGKTTAKELTVLEGRPVQIEGKKYEAIKITGLNTESLDEGDRKTIYLTFRLKNEISSINEQFITYAEIDSYSIQGGIVDCDSAPDNGIINANEVLYEDDFSKTETATIRQFRIKKLLEIIGRKH